MSEEYEAKVQEVLGDEFMGEIIAQLDGQAYKYRLLGKWWWPVRNALIDYCKRKGILTPYWLGRTKVEHSTFEDFSFEEFKEAIAEAKRDPEFWDHEAYFDNFQDDYPDIPYCWDDKIEEMYT